MTREFYEFVLPPVDVRVGPSGTTVDIDVPGFGRRDVKLSLSGDLLTIRAEKPGEGGSPEEEAVSVQRPRRLDKTVRLPAGAGGCDAGACTARYADGVLTVSIPAAGAASGGGGGGKEGAGGPPGPAA